LDTDSFFVVDTRQMDQHRRDRDLIRDNIVDKIDPRILAKWRGGGRAIVAGAAVSVKAAWQVRNRHELAARLFGLQWVKEHTIAPTRYESPSFTASPTLEEHPKS
jgi:hypothetical protein